MSKINPYIVLDFETGGLDCQKHAITQVALIFLSGDTLQEIGRYESYVKPYLMEYDQKALDFTGITLEKLERDGKPLLQVVEEMTAEIDRCKEKNGTTSYTKKPILVGQNIPFDIGFLQQIFKTTKKAIDKYFDCNKDFYGNQTPIYIDTKELGKLTFGNDETMGSYKLGLICSKLGVDLVDAHSAMNDVEGTTNALSAFASRLRAGDTGSNEDKIRIRNHFQLTM